MSASVMRTDVRGLVADMLSLALGVESGNSGTTDWRALLDFAVQERCGALAWSRSADTIRRLAPGDVVDDWRGHALHVAARGDRALQVLATVQQQLEAANVVTVSLKGPALALRIYGEPIVRPIDDLDLFVPASRMEEAGVLLLADGWQRTEFSATGQWGIFEQRSGDGIVRLELFSRFPRHSVRAGTSPPDSERRHLGEHLVRIHSGPTVAPYLASHLANHDFPPVLWFIDFASFWETLDSAERVRAFAAARQLGVQRHLRWAIERANSLEAAARGDVSALALLGFTARGRNQTRKWLRDMALADTIVGALAVLWRRLLPRSERTVSGIVRMVIRRMKHWRTSVVQSRDYQGASSGRPSPPVPDVSPRDGRRA